jgi:hypothetical protein
MHECCDLVHHEDVKAANILFGMKCGEFWYIATNIYNDRIPGDAMEVCSVLVWARQKTQRTEPYPTVVVAEYPACSQHLHQTPP